MKNENEMATLELVKPFSLVPENLEQALKLSEIMANSDMVPKDFKGKPGNVLVAVQMGGEVGLPPVQALQNIAVINGRPSLWGDGALAVVQAHPRFVSITETFDDQTQVATCVIVRNGEQPHTVTFSQQDAQTAGLWKKQGPWTQYPKRMMQMRARSFAMRDKFSDALKGISIAEEVLDLPPINMGMADVVEDDKPDILPEYAKEEFDKNLNDWSAMVLDGRATPQNIINKLRTKYTLSEAQENTILVMSEGGDK